MPPSAHIPQPWAALVPKIAEREPAFQQLSDYELRKRGLSLRYRARSGEPPGRLLVEAYALGSPLISFAPTHFVELR